MGRQARLKHTRLVREAQFSRQLRRRAAALQLADALERGRGGVVRRTWRRLCAWVSSFKTGGR
jgi:hypothetical protein